MGRNVVYITNDEQLERLAHGQPAIMPIGFPTEDVFAYDPGLAATIDSVYESGRLDWTRLKPWRVPSSSECQE